MTSLKYDQRYFDRKLGNIRRQLQEALEDIRILQEIRNKELARQGGQESKLPRKVFMRSGKRNPHGFARNTILEVIGMKGRCGWEEVQSHALSKYKTRLARTSIHDNFVRLMDEGLIDEKGHDLFELSAQGVRYLEKTRT